MSYQILMAVRETEQEILTFVITQAGHKLDQFISIEKHIKQDYDLAIIDVDFQSSGQGWHLAEQLRPTGPKKKLPIIMLTRHFSRKVIQDSNFRQLFSTILCFPISDEELIGNIERVMKLGL